MKDKLIEMASIQWIGIKFTEEQLEATFDGEISFCEAISKAVVNSHLILTSKNFYSDNMRYLLGWNDRLNIDNSSNKIDKKVHEKIISDIKPIKRKVKSIILNGDRAVIFIGIIQPERVASIFKKWYFKTGKLPLYLLSPFSLDCISCAVKCFNESYPVFSFGCDESRENNSISRDRLLIAVPNNADYLKD